MAKYAFALPELPGKDARSVPAYCQANMNAYRASRKRAGITMERAYLMPSPMGNMAIGYLELAGTFAGTMERFLDGDAFDKGFVDKLREVHGLDTSGPAPEPEMVGDWQDPEVRARKRGLSFVVPLKPGKADAGRAFATAAFETRRAEMTASRRSIGESHESVFLNATPAGDMICVYLEGNDPAQGNRDFAASHSAFDTWFKTECGKIFIDGVDFNVPLPPIAQIWDWQEAA